MVIGRREMVQKGPRNGELARADPKKSRRRRIREVFSSKNSKVSRHGPSKGRKRAENGQRGTKTK